VSNLLSIVQLCEHGRTAPCEKCAAADAPVASAAPAVTKTLLDYALDAVRRGWFVLPCYPRKKAPAGRLVPHGVDDASNDESVIRNWWTQMPDANPAIACGPSNLVIWDHDEIAPLPHLEPTFTVKTGRAQKNGIEGIQMYYTGSCDTRDIKDANGEAVGEVRSRGAYVMAAGAIHPVTGSPYILINDVPLAASSINTVAKPIVVGELLGTDKQYEIMDYVAAAFDAVEIDYLSPMSHKGGFKWLIRCPWESTHTGGKPFNTSSAVILWPDGKLIYSCQHAHCKGIHLWITQKDDPAKIGLRRWMEEKVGGKLVFSKQSEEEQVLWNGEFSKGVIRPFDDDPDEPVAIAPGSEHTGKTAYVFETAAEVEFMRELGLKGVEQNTQTVEVLRAYERVLLFGVTAATKNLQAAIGQGASWMYLPKDEAAVPVMSYRKKVYPTYQTTADAIRAHDNDFGGREALLEYFMGLEKMDAVQRMSTKRKIAPSALSAPSADATKETIAPKTSASAATSGDFEDNDIPEVGADGVLDTRIYEERGYKSVAYPDPGDNDLVTLAAKALVHGTNIPLAYVREPLKAAVLHCMSGKLIHPMYPKMSSRGYYVSCGESDSGKTTGLDFVLEAFHDEFVRRGVFIDSLFTYRSESMFVQMLSEKGTLKSSGRGKEKMMTGEAGHPNQFLHIKEGNQVATAGEYFTAIAGQLSNLYDQTSAKAASQTNKIVTAHNVTVSAVLCFTASDFYKAFSGKGAVGGGVLTRAAILCPPEDHSRDDKDWERLPQAEIDAAIYKVVKRLDWLLHQGISSPVEEASARTIRLVTKKACKAAGKYGKRVMDYFLREQVLRAVFCKDDVQPNKDFVMTEADATLAQAWATAQVEARVANWPDDGGLIEGKEQAIRRAVSRCHIPLGELKHACNYYKSGSGGHWAFAAALKNVLESRAVKRTGATRKGTPTFCPGGCVRHKVLGD